MVRFVKKYLVLMVVAILFVGAFFAQLKTNAAKDWVRRGRGVFTLRGKHRRRSTCPGLFCHIPGRSGAGA